MTESMTGSRNLKKMWERSSQIRCSAQSAYMGVLGAVPVRHSSREETASLFPRCENAFGYWSLWPSMLRGSEFLPDFEQLWNLLTPCILLVRSFFLPHPSLYFLFFPFFFLIYLFTLNRINLLM
jgi:hypothetical protein